MLTAIDCLPFTPGVGTMCTCNMIYTFTVQGCGHHEIPNKTITAKEIFDLHNEMQELRDRIKLLEK